MIRCISRRLCGPAVVAVTIIAAPAAAQPPPTPGGQPQLSGSAHLTGRVIASDDARPVRRARISLSGLPDSQRHAEKRVYVSRTVDTDLNGRYDFGDLPSGWYSITIEPVTGFVRPTRPKETTLTEGQVLSITTRLERAGAIEGRIDDENGDAMLNVQVQAVRRLDFHGHVTLRPSGRVAATNDLGRFRLFDLPAGEYYVVARHTSWLRAGEPAPRFGHAETYYPGSPALDVARVVVVRAGRDRRGVNFKLASCRLAALTIQPVDSTGVPLGRQAQLTLARRDGPYLSWSSSQTSHREDGRFVFAGVPPGNYSLVVTTSAMMEEAAYVNVTVAGDDMTLNVQTNRGASVSGRVLVDGRPAAESDLKLMSVGANPPLGKYGVTYARVALITLRGSDRFELTGLRGPMELRAEIAGGTLLSIQRAGEEIAGKTLEFVGTEVITDVVVSFTTRVAQADVTVVGTSEPNDPEPVLVVLFADDPARWHQGYVRYGRTTATRESPRRSVLSAGAGAPEQPATQLIRVPEGQYLIAAVHDADIGNPTDPGMLERLRRIAVPVTLVAGQTANVRLRVATTAR